MGPKKVARSASSDDPEELARVPLQAVLLADSFATKFRPITLERPKVLLPLVNVPMIEYTLAWLESVGVEEVFVFCCAHSNQVKDYLNKSQWTKPPSSFSFSVSTIESHDAISAGDALRVIYNRSVIRGDFILVSGDTVSNMDLTQALEEHKDRRKKDPLAVMTMVIKHAKPSSTTLQTRLGTDEIIMGIHPETKELLYYEDKADHLQRVILLDKTLLMENPALRLHNDKQDCFIDICSPEVLSLFTDNFDYQHLRRHFVKGLLVDDIMGYKIFTYETHASYAARVENFRSYDTISKDIIQRWTYPFVPDVQYLGIGYQAKLERQGIYRAPDVILSRSAHVGAFSFVGNGTTIGDHSHISTSVIGQRCVIGKNVVIESSYIWDNVTIEDGCKLSHALVCDGVHLRAGVILESGVILSFKVEVGQKLVIPAYSKVSVLPQPCKQDSDEELEYADATSGVIESPSITSVANARNQDLLSDMLDVPGSDANKVGISGVGYIWSVSEAEHDEEWRFSIAPIPKEKLEKFSHSAHDDNDEVNHDESSIPASGELIPDSDGTDFDGGVGEDYRDSADFENEVEATFRRALAGVDVQNVILEISSLRLSYNMSHADCAGALFYAIMKSASDISYSNNTELSANTKMEINKWKNLLKNYIKSQDEEIEVIMKFEEICLETIREFRPLFTDILHHLYEEDIITEDAILSWENEKQGADESDKIFVKQAEHFIKWLKEASEEDEDEDD
ncbi:translation initiation factor eIF-2B subunit epsilon protein [Dioscorea alata]|uniref:Translation initiation factor eIF-2B subunit epsilon protein n=1 Tax=Dioscorea alata TaxID=55571 RepID=A0ACB7V872_DIOAL|nr:translation initiation factor eIF-2B subunit epsilon protein [Dioscorea alata]